MIGHTPGGEVVRVMTGRAVNIIGERKPINQTAHGRHCFVWDIGKQLMDETFQITMRNRKDAADQSNTEIRVGAAIIAAVIYGTHRHAQCRARRSTV